MPRVRQRTISVAILAVALTMASCAARVKSTSNAPGARPTGTGTPIETALAYNASLADANHTLGDAAIAANKAGLLDVRATTNVTSANFTVADADRQITAMLDAIAKCISAAPAAGQRACVGNAAQLKTLIDRIVVNVDSLDKSGDLGIKDPKTQQAVEGSLATISQMAGLVLTTLQGAGLIQ